MTEPAWRPPADAWSRRDFMRNSFASVALVCTIATPSALRGRPEVTSAALRAQARSPFEPFRRDLPRIPELLPVQRTRTRDVYDVTIKEGLAEVLPGFQTPIYGYEGVYPGPTIRARTGREVVVRQRNTLPFDSNVHLHGGYVPAAHDGHPMDVIPSGGSFEYHYPNEQDAATLWYHDHAHGRTSRTLYYGLLAMYALEDDLERELDLPAGEYDVPLVIADHAFNRDGSFRYQENVDVGFRGDTILVNGAVSPRMAVRRRRYRLRLLNASNSRSYTLQPRAWPQDGADRRRRRAARRARDPPEAADAPRRARRPRDRLPRLRAGHRARAAQRRRPGRHDGGDAVRCRSAAAGARTSASRGGSARARSCRRRPRAGAGIWRWGRRRGRSTARASTRRGRT